MIDSILTAAPYVGYVVVAVLAFVLGICVTMLCTAYRKQRKKDSIEE